MKHNRKALLNNMESQVVEIAQEVCASAGARIFAKVRVADVLPIDGSGISNELYSYALKAHFDVIVSKENEAYLAIEFDGAGHNNKNDVKKDALCDIFQLPLVRIDGSHLRPRLPKDTALSLLVWQLFCVDAYIEQFGSDPNEAYDPSAFISLPGRSNWPFNFSAKVRGRLERSFKNHLHLFSDKPRDDYSFGLLQFGAIEGCWRKEGEYRGLCAQLVNKSECVVGWSTLQFRTAGLGGQREELFGEMAAYLEGFAAEEMYAKALEYLRGGASPTSINVLAAEAEKWEAAGFRLRRALNFPFSGK